MLPSSSQIQQEQLSQIYTGDVIVELQNKRSLNKSIGLSSLLIPNYYVTGLQSTDRLHILTGNSGQMLLTTVGVSSISGLSSLSGNIYGISTGINAQNGIAISMGNSTIKVHQIEGGATFQWRQREFNMEGTTQLGTSILLTSSVPSSTTGPSRFVPYININDDYRTIYMTYHQLSGGTYSYLAYFSHRESLTTAFPGPTRLDDVSYRSSYYNNNQLNSYLNVHNTGNDTSLLHLGLSDSRNYPIIFQYNLVETSLSHRGSKIFINDLFTTQPTATGTSMPFPQPTITELKQGTETFLSINMPDFSVNGTPKPLISRTWRYKDRYTDNHARPAVGVSISNYDHKTLSYRGTSFDYDLDLYGITGLGGSFNTNTYYGSSRLNLLSYVNNNNDSFNFMISNTDVRI